jgi:Recombinase
MLPRRTYRQADQRHGRVVIRQIFTWSAEGLGFTRIAKRLNAEGAPTPVPVRGGPAAWSPITVREVLHRPLYRGEIIYNKTQRRGADGAAAYAPRPESEWLRVDRPDLRIVSDDRLARRAYAYRRSTVAPGDRNPWHVRQAPAPTGCRIPVLTVRVHAMRGMRRERRRPGPPPVRLHRLSQTRDDRLSQHRQDADCDPRGRRVAEDHGRSVATCRRDRLTRHRVRCICPTRPREGPETSPTRISDA